MTRTIAVLNALTRPLFEPHRPDWVEARYYSSTEELMTLAPEAEIGWMDLYNTDDMFTAIRSASKLKWLNSIYAGVERFPLDLLRERNVVFTYGSGINAIPIAEWVVMGMLTQAKGFPRIIEASQRREWLREAPGGMELYRSKALILGHGAIGQRLSTLLAAFDVELTTVRRTPGPGTLAPDQWRSRLGEFDWIILAVPATAETEHMIGAVELAAMKPGAQIVNIARGSVIDQAALTTALRERRIGGAFLDVTTPEPLPAEDELWSLDNAQISMHLSGPSSHGKMFSRSVERFIANLHRFKSGERLEPQVDFERGY